MARLILITILLFLCNNIILGQSKPKRDSSKDFRTEVKNRNKNVTSAPIPNNSKHKNATKKKSINESSVRQIFLAKAASVGASEAIDYKESLDEALRLQDKDAFDRYITEFLKERIEMRLIIEAHEIYLYDLDRNKAIREFVNTAEGHRMIDEGRKIAFDYAHDKLQQLFPDLDIPPFPNDKFNWFE